MREKNLLLRRNLWVESCPVGESSGEENDRFDLRLFTEEIHTSLHWEECLLYEKL